MEIRLYRHFGINARVFLRDVAREMCGELYFQKIVCQISGNDERGRNIPINNVGKWLWGVSGYKGHLRTVNFKGETVLCQWPEKSPEIVNRLMAEIKEKIESGKISAQVISRWDGFF